MKTLSDVYLIKVTEYNSILYDFDNLSFEEKQDFFILLEYLTAKRKIYEAKNESDDINNEIRWDAGIISFMQLYSKLNHQEENTVDNTIYSQKKNIIEISKEEISELCIYFDWYSIIELYSGEIPQEMIEIADGEGLIWWDDISSITTLDKNFLIANADKINWDVFIESHELEDLPIELQSHEKLMTAIRNNSDIISMKANKATITESNIRFKRFSWIDRVAGVEGHYQDDTGLWVDTLRGAAADDSDNLESDLEHSEYDAYNEEKYKKEIEEIEL